MAPGFLTQTLAQLSESHHRISRRPSVSTQSVSTVLEDMKTPECMVALVARRHRSACQRLAQHVEIVGGLLRELELAELMRREATQRSLEQLRGALRRCYKLVAACQDCGYLRSLLAGARMADELRAAEQEIDMFIRLIPLIALVDNTYDRSVKVRAAKYPCRANACGAAGPPRWPRAPARRPVGQPLPRHPAWRGKAVLNWGRGLLFSFFLLPFFSCTRDQTAASAAGRRRRPYSGRFCREKRGKSFPSLP
ncbi:hypothetical protein HU200_043133 [Digitaria exilis]|uniref:MCAfunc domain-containing protein n=1 Tax=Digitaria exilis TaxID=1010633 RepID=A0A835EED4_9POAL|nr:hypothetical protein HU200_043133 [Digitaria exilis]